MHINLREFVPIFLALRVWGESWHHLILTFYCYNQAVVEVICMHSSWDSGMLAILPAIIQLSLTNDFVDQAEYLPGKHNTLADTLSRSQPDPTFLKWQGLHMEPEMTPSTLLSWIKPYRI